MTTHGEWHILTAEEAIRTLGSHGDHGLDEHEARHRLDTHGPNRLPERPPRPAWRQFLDQFRSLLTLVLLAAGLLAGVIGDTTDMGVILCVVLFNAGLGFYQEHRAERILDALKGMLAPQSRVRRGGRKQEVAAHDLVPGDLVLLEAGDRVPADGRLVQAHGLEIDESTLTGESLAVCKSTAPLAETDTALADRSNLAFMNTVVTKGRGEMVLTATGPATEMGRIAGMLETAAAGRTPLQDRLDQLGRRLAMLAGVVVAIITVMGLVRGEPISQVVLTAVALAVAAIPEGLPAVVTVTLAIGMYRMAGRGAIVKRLAAVETLGSTTVICSDKTGTLTMNQMTARAGWAAGQRFLVSGQGYGREGKVEPSPACLPRCLRPALLCNDSRLAPGEGGVGRVVVGDPTEGALLVLAEKAGLEDGTRPRVAELPFDSARKFMSTLHQGGLLLVKGAPDVVLRRCSHVLMEEGARPLDDSLRALLQAEMEHMADQALRVLALAERDGVESGAELDAASDGLTLLALVGLLDPPRPGAHPAVEACRAAGIEVKMITGDHGATARAIAREVGLEGDALCGADLDRMRPGELEDRIAQVAVFSRVAPEHKLALVQALQAKGHVVAMTGDGVNDAAALKGADIGIAMGRTGSDVTREAAAMVLTDDEFSTIVGAVREGRTIYDNILKFVRFQLSTNMGALLAVFAAPLLGLPSPFHPIQILWVNIIMDGPPAMALAFDPPRAGLMDQPPRPRDEAILTRSRLLRLVAYGLTMATGTLGLLWWALEGGAPREEAGTLAFTTFVLFQFFNLFNARVGMESAFNRSLVRNGKLWLALGGVLALQAVVVHWGPAQALFHTTALSPGQWGLAALVASSVLVLDEARKLIIRLFK